MRTGRCLCGAVRYELAVEPQTFALCHCRDCQYVTGGEPAAVAVAPGEAFRVTQGALKAYRSVGDSGAEVARNFCPECGTQVMSAIAGGLIAVKVGTLDEPLASAPQIEVWTASAQPWAHHPDGVMRFERNPG